MAIALRDATVKDVPALARIYGHYVTHSACTFEEVPPADAEMESRLAAVRAGGWFWLVAEEEGAVLGYAYASAFRTRNAYRFTVEDAIYVAPASAGKGIGTLLMEELIRRCTTAGYRQMLAVIGDSANAASIALHKRLGFEHVGLLRATGFKFGRWVDVVMMQLPLGPGADNAPTASPAGHAASR
jgi:phosphinothricin acetyltransferase